MRTHAHLRDGDIDLLVEHLQPGSDRLVMSWRIGGRTERQLGLKKVDILVNRAEHLGWISSVELRASSPVICR